MAKIHEIKLIKLVLLIECDCGNLYKWLDSGNTKCPKCGTEHEIVMAPKSIKPDIKPGMVSMGQPQPR